MPRLALELFSGTGSVRKVLEAKGWQVTSLDNDPKAGADITCDICAWDYTTFEPGHFEYVHASPPCTEYSRALTSRPRDLAVGDALVDKTLEIITHLRPRWWTIENPDSLMKTRPAMQHLRAFMKRCCYCVYSDDEGTHAYRKPTCIWTNLGPGPLGICARARRPANFGGPAATPRSRSAGRGGRRPRRGTRTRRETCTRCLPRWSKSGRTPYQSDWLLLSSSSVSRRR